MLNWVRLPDNTWLNMNNVANLNIKKLSNPGAQYVILAQTTGGTVQVAQGFHQEDKAVRVVEAILRAAKATVEDLPTKFDEVPSLPQPT
jgi:hypothetical protein